MRSRAGYGPMKKRPPTALALYHRDTRRMVDALREVLGLGPLYDLGPRPLDVTRFGGAFQYGTGGWHDGSRRTSHR